MKVRIICFLAFLVSLLASSQMHSDSGPVDVVYTWVDNADLRWQYSRSRAYKKFRRFATSDANGKMRFRNCDELKYSLRSLHKFLPFVRHIYVVTAEQVPNWFKAHPKITFVFHSTIFPNRNNLPTFNSHAIEANLHRIPGLSENYIYVNDDVFFASPMNKGDFFDENGRMKLFFGDYPTPSGPMESQENGWRAAWKNTNTLLSSHFRQEYRKGFCTAPFAFNKSVVKKVERTFGLYFKKVSANKFRSRMCYAITNGLIPYSAWYWNMASVGSIKHITVHYGSQFKANKEQLNEVRRSKLHTFAIEDMSPQESLELNELLHSFLESKYPEKAPWEN